MLDLEIITLMHWLGTCIWNDIAKQNAAHFRWHTKKLDTWNVYTCILILS